MPWSKLALKFAQPNAGSSTIFCDEFDPGLFEGTPHIFERARIPVNAIAALRSDLETLALSIARAAGKPTATELSEQAAEAQLQLFRIRKVRATLVSGNISYEELNKQLAGLERYERRAFSRRKRALREL